MTRREQLQDQYEDALFALLMDEMAAAEGEKALVENERLKNDPDAAVPEKITQACMQTIRTHYAKEKVKSAGRFTAKAFTKVALLAGVCAMFFTVAFASSETVRVHTMNLVVEVFGESTDFYFENNRAANAIPPITVGWLPSGYTLENQAKDDFDAWYLYQKSDGETINIKYTLSDGAVLSVDTENAKTETIQIDGVQAMLITKGSVQQILWATESKTAFISLIGTGVPTEELIHVASELKY